MEKRYLAYRVLTGFTVQAPVFALFYQASGLDHLQVMQLVLVFALSKILFDLPSGIFADRVGRRTAVWCRLGLEAASVAAMIGHQFLLSSFLAGAAFAFSSGAESALAYEWFGPRFQRVFGRASSWGFLSTAVAAIAGGLLAGTGFERVYALRLVTLAAAFVVSLGFEEPARPRAVVPLRASWSFPAGLRRALAFIGIIGAVQVAAVQLHQPYLKEAGIPIAAIGALYVGFQVLTAAGARWAHRLPPRLGVLLAGSAGGFALLALPAASAGLAGLALLKFVHGVSIPSLGQVLNERAPAAARATSLSFRSLFEGGALALAAPALGWTADAFSLHAAFGLAALLVLPALGFVEAPCVASSGSPARP